MSHFIEIRYSPEVEARFNKHCEPVTESGCWLWVGSRSPGGYGRFNIDGRLHNANRVAWELWRGPISEGMCVCHKCDTPACVNPDHLFLGTHAENQRDKANKGRSADVRGSKHPLAKIVEADVVKIRADGRLHRQIAAEYGVSEPAVYKIKRGLTWGHVPWQQ